MIMQQVIADFRFAQDSGEFQRLAPMMRYVVCINDGLSKRDFVDTAAHLGYNPKTAAIQYAASRKIDAEFTC